MLFAREFRMLKLLILLMCSGDRDLYWIASSNWTILETYDSVHFASNLFRAQPTIGKLALDCKTPAHNMEVL